MLLKPLDRVPVIDGTKGCTVERVVELSQVNACQTAVALHMRSDLKPHVIHRAQHAAVAGTGEADHAASFQHSFDLGLSKLVPHQRLEQALAEDLIQLLELRFSQARHEHRVQGLVVREQHTLAPVEPQQIGVPACARSGRVNEAVRDFRQQFLRTMNQERHGPGFIPCDGSRARDRLSSGTNESERSENNLVYNVRCPSRLHSSNVKPKR